MKRLHDCPAKVVCLCKHQIVGCMLFHSTYMYRAPTFINILVRVQFPAAREIINVDILRVSEDVSSMTILMAVETTQEIHPYATLILILQVSYVGMRLNAK